MVTKGFVLLLVAGACAAYPLEEEPRPQSTSPVDAAGQQADSPLSSGPVDAAAQPVPSQPGVPENKPVPLGPEPLNEEKKPADKSDLKTDASTWWAGWNRWGRSYYQYPTYYTTRTRYVYTPRTYTYYAPYTYSSYWSEPHAVVEEW